MPYNMPLEMPGKLNYETKYHILTGKGVAAADTTYEL
jgi:hypothetical protein